MLSLGYTLLQLRVSPIEANAYTTIHFIAFLLKISLGQRYFEVKLELLDKMAPLALASGALYVQALESSFFYFPQYSSYSINKT